MSVTANGDLPKLTQSVCKASGMCICRVSVCVCLLSTTHRGLSRVFSFLSGGETSGAGQAGFPQHTQEVDRLSAGPAGRGCGKEVCQVTLGEKQPRLRGEESIQEHVNNNITEVPGVYEAEEK